MFEDVNIHIVGIGSGIQTLLGEYTKETYKGGYTETRKGYSICEAICFFMLQK